MALPFSPKPYQETGIDYLTANSRGLLGDDAGLGKSMQMILAANKRGADRILIFTPAIGRISWKLQLQDWDETERPVLFFPAPPGTGGKASDRYTLPKGRLAVVVTYEWLSRADSLELLLDAIAASEPFDGAMMDEAHALKTPNASRTKALYGRKGTLQGSLLSGPSFKFRWIATATPTPKGHVGELYSHLKALFPDILARLFRGQIPNIWDFEDRFCNVVETPFGREIAGNNADTIQDLRDALRPFILMRRKADVLTELPPIQTVALPIETGFKQHKDDPAKMPTDADLAGMSDDQVIQLLTTIAAAGSQTTDDDPDELTPRQRLGLAKVAALRGWIEDFLSSDPTRKLVIFAHHRLVLQELHEICKPFGAVLFHGGTSPAHKTEAVRSFQNDPYPRVFIGQNIAAGVAITLTAADTVLLVEPHPTPDMNYQMISRTHRLGQPNSVTAIFPYDDKVALERRHVQILRRRANENRNMFGVETPGVI